MNKGIEYYNDLSVQYDKASLSVQKEIEAFYQRFADNNQMDLFEARKLLNTRQLKEFRWSVEEYIEKGKTLNYSDQWAKELENASTRHRVTRLQAMQLQMQQQVEALMGNEVDGLDNVISDIYEDGYYRTIFEVQKGVGVGESFATLDTDKISKVISKPWATDGTNFSEKVWGEHRASLVQSLNTDFTQAIIRGDAPDKLIKKISDDFGVAKYKAKRLVLTESAFFSSESHRDAYKELGVDEVMISTTLDSDTCNDCGQYDGEKVPLDLYQPGATVPPFHPNCRCTTVPVDDFDDGIESYRAARDENGKYYEVPDSMTYKQWKEKYVDGKSNDKVNIKSDKKETEKKVVPEVKLEKLQKRLSPNEYQTYTDMIKENDDIANLYSKYGDKISEINRRTNGGSYDPNHKRINFDVFYRRGYSPQYEFNTLAHEYGHAFDHIAQYKDLHFEEINVLNKYCDIELSNNVSVFETVPSTSDEFLNALREDRKLLREIYMRDRGKELYADLLSTSDSGPAQDVIGGFFGSYGLVQTHADSYYDSIYNRFIKAFKQEDNMKKAFAELGTTIKTKANIRGALRIYKISSEAWADIASAATCGGKILDYVKKYLPNSYKAFTNIIKRVV